MFPVEVFSGSKPATSHRFFVSVLALLTLSYSHVAAANDVPLQCPPDVFSAEYDSYIKLMGERVGYKLEPSIYGTEEMMMRLVKEFEESSPPPAGSNIMEIYFTDLKGSGLLGARCIGDCSQEDYTALAGRCAMEMGSTCLDFAVVIDGKAQCLMIPRPKLQ